MIPAHSPAPWYRPQDPQHHAEVYVTETEDKEDLELIFGGVPALNDYEALANGCLIEVSPELLSAAEALLEIVTQKRNSAMVGDYSIAESYGFEDDEVATLRDVILKYEEGVRSGTEAIDRMRAEHQAKAEPTIRETLAFREKAAGITP